MPCASRVRRPAGVDVPKLIEPRRVSWVTLLLVIGTLIGGWALIGVLINVGKSWSTITGAKWGWVVAVFVLAQAAYPAIAVTTVGSVTDPLPYGRTLALELSDTFVALAGGSMAVLATRVRFFQQEGYSPTVAVSSGVLVSTASWIVKGALFLIALPLGPRVSTSSRRRTTAAGTPTWSGSSSSSSSWPGWHSAWCSPYPGGGGWRRPEVATQGVGGVGPPEAPRHPSAQPGGDLRRQSPPSSSWPWPSVPALHAFGDHLGLATLLVVLTLGSMLGGVSPVPGGMGVVEAGMIIGLTAAGISETDAVAAVFVQRLFTAYLPPIWGWFVLVWLRRKEYL
jgi:uncharacterized membrane protein YbhN (UPF0104 family)